MSVINWDGIPDWKSTLYGYARTHGPRVASYVYDKAKSMYRERSRSRVTNKQAARIADVERRKPPYRAGIRQVQRLSLFERYGFYGVSDNVRRHNTNMDTRYLAVGATTVTPNATGTDYTSDYNNLRLLRSEPGQTAPTNDFLNMYMVDIFQNIREGTAESQRTTCSIDISACISRWKLINRTKFPVMVRLMFVELTQKDDLFQFKPNTRNNIIGDLFEHPEDPCAVLDMEDAYWTSEGVDRKARMKCKLNRHKWKVWQERTVYLPACPMAIGRFTINTVNQDFTYDKNDVPVTGVPEAPTAATGWTRLPGTSEIQDQNISVKNPMQYIVDTAMTIRNVSARYYNSDTNEYKYLKPNIYIMGWALSAVDDPCIHPSGLSPVDYQHEIDIRFKNIVK